MRYAELSSVLKLALTDCKVNIGLVTDSIWGASALGGEGRWYSHICQFKTNSSSKSHGSWLATPVLPARWQLSSQCQALMGLKLPVQTEIYPAWHWQCPLIRINAGQGSSRAYHQGT